MTSEEFRAECCDCDKTRDAPSKPRAYAWARKHADEHEARGESCSGVTITPVVK